MREDKTNPQSAPLSLLFGIKCIDRRSGLWGNSPLTSAVSQRLCPPAALAGACQSWFGISPPCRKASRALCPLQNAQGNTLSAMGTFTCFHSRLFSRSLSSQSCYLCLMKRKQPQTSSLPTSAPLNKWCPSEPLKPMEFDFIIFLRYVSL